MKVLHVRPAPSQGRGNFKSIAEFDVEINEGLRLQGLLLSRAPDGKLFVFAPSKHGKHFASFTTEYARSLAAAAYAATGGDVAHDNRAA